MLFRSKLLLEEAMAQVEAELGDVEEVRYFLDFVRTQRTRGLSLSDPTERRNRSSVGVVGVGHLGRHHARLYASLPGARLVGVVDRDARAGRERSPRSTAAQAFGDAGELIGQVEAASVAVPTENHREVAEPLLDGGVDVLVEKPLARTLDEADAIIAAAEAHGRLVMVGHTERFNPAVMALARAVDAAAVLRDPPPGRVHRAQHRHRRRARSDDPRSRPAAAPRRNASRSPSMRPASRR